MRQTVVIVALVCLLAIFIVDLQGTVVCAGTGSIQHIDFAVGEIVNRLVIAHAVFELAGVGGLSVGIINDKVAVQGGVFKVSH